MRRAQVFLVLAVLFVLSANVAAAAFQPYLVRIDVNVNGACGPSESWKPVAGARITIINNDGSRRQVVTNDQGPIITLARGTVILEIEYPATIVPCPGSPTRIRVDPPQTSEGPIVKRVDPPAPEAQGQIALPTVGVTFRGRSLHREN